MVDRFVVSSACIAAVLFMFVRLIEGGSTFDTVMRCLTMITYSYYAYSVLRRGVQ
jgi:hypothetical protein